MTTLAPIWPVDDHSRATPAGSPIYIVLRLPGGGYQAAHGSAHRQGEVVERGLTMERAIKRAVEMRIAANGQGGPG